MPRSSPAGGAEGRPCRAETDVVANDGSALLAIQFVDATTGWVVTGHGVVATTDGGQHWHRQLDRRVRVTAGVDFIDDRHGWVLADGALLTTADGGRRWVALPTQCPRISQVHFSTPVDGYAATGGRLSSGAWRAGPLLRTRDGGHTWVRVDSPPQPQQVCLTDSSHGWLAAAGEVYRTVDGGRSWPLVEAGVRHVRHFTPSAELQCSGGSDAWALLIGGAGMSQQAHTAFHLHGDDSFPLYTEQFFPHPGVHTDVESPGSYSGPFSAVSSTTAVFIDYCPACGAGTAPVAVTYDGGRTILRRGDLPGLSQATGASFVTGEQGWVIGAQQLWRNRHHRGVRYRILHTVDGARHWTTQRQVTHLDRS